MRKYFLFDCKENNFGRIATAAARVLQGKHKTDYAPNEDKGDFAVFVNCSRMKFSGSKEEQKMYHHFSGYPGGISSKKLGDLLKVSPEKVVRSAIYGMLPKNKLRNERMKRILIFSDANHGLKAEVEKIK